MTTTTMCPSWCANHAQEDDEGFLIHERTIIIDGIGDFIVSRDDDPDSPDGGPVVALPQFEAGGAFTIKELADLVGAILQVASSIDAEVFTQQLASHMTGPSPESSQ